MQVWLFFQAGAGGDGLANLLEHSANVVTLDGRPKHWRVHRIVDDRIKFSAPSVDHNACFRRGNGSAFLAANNQLHEHYVDIAWTQPRNCVVTSHDLSLSLLQNSDCQHIFSAQQIRVAIINHNTVKQSYDSHVKNLLTSWQHVYADSIDVGQFDYVLDMELLQQDWQLMQNFCEDIGLHLCQSSFSQYQKLLQGDVSFVPYNHKIPRYKLHMQYELLNASCQETSP